MDDKIAVQPIVGPDCGIVSEIVAGNSSENGAVFRGAASQLYVIFPKRGLNPIKEKKVKAVLFDLFETLVSQYDPDFNQKKLTSIHPTFVS